MEEREKTGVTEETRFSDRNYLDVNLEQAESNIHACLKDAARNVITVGFYLKQIRDKELYQDAGYETIWDYAAGTFGFSKSTASRYMARNDKFSVDGNSPYLAEKYQEYSKAQLQEMLSLDADQLENVTPGMTVREIRELKKTRELPYYGIPGQMDISDFPELEETGEEKTENMAAAAEEAEMIMPLRGTFTVSAEDLIEDSENECVATPQQESDSDALQNCSENTENAAEKKRYPMDDYGFREKRCNELARKLISDWKSWFRQDFQNRVLNVVESEKQIKEKIKSSSNRTWWLKSDDGEMMHVNLFDKYIQFWGKDFLGNCEWFYLCAAIQSMWNVIAIENAQKIAANSTDCTSNGISSDQYQVEEDDENEENTEEIEAPKRIEYDHDTLEKMIQDARGTLNQMKDYWLKGQPYTYAKYSMMIQAYELLMKNHEAAETDLESQESEITVIQPELPLLKNNDQRAAFIDAYESWPLWIDTQATGERYYRYDLPDETSFVVKVYHAMVFRGWEVESGSRYEEGYGLSEQYILEPGKLFRDCRANRSAMIEKLKELQKSNRGGEVT